MQEEDREEIGRRSVIMMLTAAGELAPVEPSAEAPDTAEFAVAEDKYDVEGTIGAGGMGEVLLVHDRDLRRQVAMKVLREEIAKDPAQKLNFVAEAQATSQLEHPGIPPVHDIGVTPSGRVYFTMKLVRGKTLQEVLRDLAEGDPETEREYTLHKLVSILERVSEALHFAHERGVIHRDLKPENLMLGEYGEVHVMDWGIAKVAGEVVQPEAPGAKPGFMTESEITTAGTEAGMMTMDGTLKGTVPYMSPEQANGIASEITSLSDIYALGALLYEMLTLHPAFEFQGLLTIVRVVQGEFIPVAERNAKRPVPEALADLCTRAMALSPTDRPATAAEFALKLRAWLDGRSESDRRHREAEILAAKGQEAVESYHQMREELRRARGVAKGLAGQFKPWQPVVEKMPLIEAQERAEHLRSEIALAFAEAMNLLGAALLQEEDNATARAALADIWAGRLKEAELRGDQADAVFALSMIRRYDDGHLARLLSGDGSLILDSEPTGAEVFLTRFGVENGMLREGGETHLGQTPLAADDLPMGSYVVILRAPGYPDVRYPVEISRNREWRGTVRLRTAEEIGEGFVYVPGGPFTFREGPAAHVIELPDFAIARQPVTMEEYAEFLQSLPPEEVEARLPKTPGDGPYMERSEDGAFHCLPVIVEGPARERTESENGFGFEMQLPAVGLAFEDVVAYCEWKTAATGREFRLPTEEEREKAARGVDGRKYPWGELEDATLAKCRDSRNEPSQLEPVGTFPTATSVYGMGDAAGGVWDWTSSWFDPGKTLRVLKGGAWSMAITTLRSAIRYRGVPRFRDANIGFRCARSLPSGD
jgi:eukaryotic-like serine/threonine-protein kinase